MTRLVDAPKADLERSAERGVRWTGFAHAARQGLQLLTTFALTRMLIPEDFGLAAIVMILVAFVDLVQDFGLSSAIVQRKTVSRKLASSVFWFNLTVALTAALGVYLAAPWIERTVGDARITPLLAGAAALFIARSLTLLPRAELSRRMDFATLSRVELSSAIIGAAFAIGVAWLGGGVWALIVQPLVATALLAARLWTTTEWRPRVEFSLRELGSVRRYSGWLALFNVLDFFHLYGAHLLISYYFPESRLGVYYLAFRVTTFPAGAVSNSISRVLFPYLSRVIHDEEHASKSYLSIVRAIGLCVFPTVIGFAAVADLFFDVVSGPVYRDCGLVAVLLTPIGLSRAIATTTGPIYQAKGRTDLMFGWGIYYVVIVLIAFAIGVRWDIHGVAIAYSATLLFAYPLFKVPAGLIGVRFRQIVAALARPLAMCVTMAAAVLSIRAILEPVVGPTVTLVFAVATGVAVYATLVAAFAGGEMESVIKRLRSR